LSPSQLQSIIAAIVAILAFATPKLVAVAIWLYAVNDDDTWC
jgi:hypothetical protein